MPHRFPSRGRRNDAVAGRTDQRPAPAKLTLGLAGRLEYSPPQCALRRPQ